MTVRAIHKYTVYPQRGTYKVDMPLHSRVLSVQEVGGHITIWTLYDPSILDIITATVKVVTSDENFTDYVGANVPNQNPMDFRYVGTVLYNHGGYAAHVLVSGA